MKVPKSRDGSRKGAGIWPLVVMLGAAAAGELGVLVQGIGVAGAFLLAASLPLAALLGMSLRSRARTRARWRAAWEAYAQREILAPPHVRADEERTFSMAGTR